MQILRLVTGFVAIILLIVVVIILLPFIIVKAICDIIILIGSKIIGALESTTREMAEG